MYFFVCIFLSVFFLKKIDFLLKAISINIIRTLKMQVHRQIYDGGLINKFNSMLSLYVPAIGDMKEDQITQVFWENGIGNVSRIDYFKNSSDMWCAFVHFSNINNNTIVYEIEYELNTYGSYKLWFNETEYLILRHMMSPKIPDTYLNIHQIAAKLDEKDNEIYRLQEVVNKDCEKIKILQTQLNRLENIMFNMQKDADMEQMVTSLVGPRWTQEDDEDLASPVAVVCKNESKTSSNQRIIFDLCGDE